MVGRLRVGWIGLNVTCSLLLGHSCIRNEFWREGNQCHAAVARQL